MKREIKFEYGFSSINGIVKKKYYLSEIPFMHDKCDVWQILPIVYVRQFTGLKDKNGVDIYDGDIIEKYFEKFEIIWNEGAWQLTKINDWYKQQFYIAHLFDYEKAVVVGNIYENPELLKP